MAEPALPQSVAAARQAVTSGVGAGRIVDGVLSRLAGTEPRVHAYTTVFEDELRQQAAELDAYVAAGGVPGPLAGVAVGVKDMLRTREAPTRAGLEFALMPAGVDAPAIAALRAAGALVVGKHVCHALGLGAEVPPTRNAWGHGRYPGGSSAGGGPSVAVGSCLVAIGVDAAGSIRKPAALNGVAGFRPTPGAVSVEGMVPTAGKFDQIGWMAPHARDCLAVARVLLPAAFAGEAASPALRVAGARLGVLTGALGESIVPAVREVIAHGLDVLRDGGAVAEMVSLDDHDAIVAAFFTMLQSGTVAVARNLTRMALDGAPPAVVQALAAVREPSLAAMANAELIVAQARDVLRTAVAAFDVVVCPTVELPPLPVEQMCRRPGAVDPDILMRYCRWTVLASLAELPAISIPVGQDRDGFPVGLQLIGAPDADRALLELASSIHDALSAAIPAPAVI